MFDFTRQRTPAQPDMMGPDFAGASTPLMQPSTLIESVMAQHPQGGGGSGMGSALAGLGGAIGTRLGSHGGEAAPNSAVHEMGHSEDFMHRKRPPFQSLGPPTVEAY